MSEKLQILRDAVAIGFSEYVAPIDNLSRDELIELLNYTAGAYERHIADLRAWGHKKEEICIRDSTRKKNLAYNLLTKVQKI